MKRYVIGVRGSSGRLIAEAFSDLNVTSGPEETVLSGELADQAALFGVLGRIRDLGLELLWTRTEPSSPRPPPGPATAD